MYERFLQWRGIDTHAGDVPCPRCKGAGVRGYGDGSTWRMRGSGQRCTMDVCDHCWGSGNAEKPWLNLRSISPAELDRLRSVDEAMEYKMGFIEAD
jgi:hypothetical protein